MDKTSPINLPAAKFKQNVKKSNPEPSEMTAEPSIMTGVLNRGRALWTDMKGEELIAVMC